MTREGDGRVLIWGDSFAAHLFYGLENRFAGSEVDIRQYTATSCRPIEYDRGRCRGIYQAADGILAAYQPDIVILAGFWPRMIGVHGAEEFAERLSRSVELVQSHGALPIVTGQSPTYSVALARLGFVRDELRQQDAIFFDARNNRRATSLVEGVASERGVPFVDFYDICEGVRCLAFSNGIPLHWDTGHMTAEGSIHYTGSLEEVIRAAINRTEE